MYTYIHHSSKIMTWRDQFTVEKNGGICIVHLMFFVVKRRFTTRYLKLHLTQQVTLSVKTAMR